MLPERRKSAEEIAKLRESMGVPGAEKEQPEPAAEPESAPTDVFEPPPAEEPAPLPAAKPVRSLRKSEQQPRERKPAPPADPAAPIPFRRHSERELMEMRREQATPPDQAIAYVEQLAVPWPVVMFAYFLPLIGALLGWFAAWSPGVPEPDFPADWIASLSRKPWLAQSGFMALIAFCILAFAAAGWISWKKPRSRHHAGFVSILAVLVAVFGIIHHFTPTYGP